MCEVTVMLFFYFQHFVDDSIAIVFRTRYARYTQEVYTVQNFLLQYEWLRMKKKSSLCFTPHWDYFKFLSIKSLEQKNLLNLRRRKFPTEHGNTITDL